MRIVALILELRWRVFRNSLRAGRGRLEFAARAGVSVMLFALATAGGIGLAVLTAGTFGEAWFAPLLGWTLVALTVSWVLMPVMTATFGDGLDAGQFRRYPFTSWHLVAVDLLIGAGDPWTIFFYPLLAGVAVGIAVAEPTALVTGLPALLLLAVFCVATLRFIQRVVAGLFASRRRRELVVLVFFLLLLTPQMLIVWTERGDREGRSEREEHSTPGEKLDDLRERASTWLMAVEWSPPALAARALTGASERGPYSAVAGLAGVLGWAGLAIWLVRAQMEREFKGATGSAIARGAREASTVRRGWAAALSDLFPWLSAQGAAVAEKDLLYLVRSPRALVALVFAPIVAIVLSMGPMASSAAVPFSKFRLLGITFYMLLAISQLAVNAFGLDRDGAKNYVLAPMRMRDVLIAKNSVTALAFGFVLAVSLAGIALVAGALPIETVLACTCSAAVGITVVLAAGNLISSRFPKGVDPGSITAQGSKPGMLLAFVVSLVTLGLFALGPLLAWATGSTTSSYLVLGLEAVAAALFYRWALERASRSLEAEPEPFLTALLASD